MSRRPPSSILAFFGSPAHCTRVRPDRAGASTAERCASPTPDGPGYGVKNEDRPPQAPVLAMRGAGYRYPTAARPAVAGVDLAVEAGELVLVTGPTGCGKSTLLALAAGLLERHGHGEVAGEIRVAGVDPARAAPSERIRLVGFVSQDPTDQIVTRTAADEVAFGLESARWSAEAIAARIPEVLAEVGLDIDPERETRALSGGQKQRLVVAAALAGGARLLLLDEPLSQLDPAGAHALVARLRALADRGVGVVVVEHRLDPLMQVADRVVVMAEGRVVADGAEADIGLLRRLGLGVPGLVDLADRLAHRGLTPAKARFRVPAAAPVETGRILLRASGLGYRYRGSSFGIDGIDLTLCAGERVALVGANGAGKSTLLAALAGQIAAGAVERAGRVVHVPQEPDLALFCETVREELAHGPREAGLARAQVERRVALAARALGVTDLLDRPPQALSRGQRLRVAVAAALSCDPDVLALDEPTSGQDRVQVERMMAALREVLADRALLFATHDLDLAFRHATRLVVLHAGRVLAEGEPAAIVAALPAPLPVPPLVRYCLDRGLPPMSAEALCGLVETA